MDKYLSYAKKLITVFLTTAFIFIGISDTVTSSAVSSGTIPFTIRIHQMNIGEVEIVPFKLYTRRVLPNEWPISKSPIEALKAGAVAIKSYGWYYNTYPKRFFSLAHLNNTASDQVYDHDYDFLPLKYKNMIDGVVEESWLVGLKKNNVVFKAEYWNGRVQVYRKDTANLSIRATPEKKSDNIIKEVPEGTILWVVGSKPVETDGLQWWEVVEPDERVYGWAPAYYLQAMDVTGKPTIDEAGINGRMSQWGSIYWAEQGKDFMWILSYFYKDVELFEIASSPPTFAIGDRIQATDILNVRSGAHIGENITWTAERGNKGTIIYDDFMPQSSQGYIWWKIRWDSGIEGWSSQHRFELITTAN